jgi:isopropanol dehydrogenase (NADP+)
MSKTMNGFVMHGFGMSDKTKQTTLCPGGSERLGRLLRLIKTGRVDPLALTLL